MTSRRVATAALVGMASASALAEWARPTIKESDLLRPLNLAATVPKAFGAWVVDDSVPVIVPPPDQQAVLDKIYNQTLARTYVNPQGQRVMLSIAYGGDQSDGLTVHVPDVCYAAQGFRITAAKDGSLVLGGLTIPVRHLLATLGSRIEPITYWVIVGDEATISMSRRRMVSLRYGLRRRIPEGMLVRVSTIDRDSSQAYLRHAEFLEGLMSTLATDDRIRFIGTVHRKIS